MFRRTRNRTIQPRKPDRCFSHCAFKYTVKSEDTIYNIAMKFGVSIHVLRIYNRHILNLNYIFPGDILCIPKSKPYCSFVTPTPNSPKDSYALVASSNGIYFLANLPPIEELGVDFIGYYAYAVTTFDYNYAALTRISKSPSIWVGEINEKGLDPSIKIIISAIKDKSKSNPPGDLVLFESS